MVSGQDIGHQNIRERLKVDLGNQDRLRGRKLDDVAPAQDIGGAEWWISSTTNPGVTAPGSVTVVASLTTFSGRVSVSLIAMGLANVPIRGEPAAAPAPSHPVQPAANVQNPIGSNTHCLMTDTSFEKMNQFRSVEM